MAITGGHATGNRRGEMKGVLRYSPQHGIALVVVLWLVALLALMAVSQSAAVRTETLVVGNLVESARARAAAYAGLQLAIAELAKPLPARQISSDGSVYGLRFDAAQLFISISEESGKVDLNAAPATLLSKLLAATGVEEERRLALVDAIQDWRDRDNLRRLNGAEEEEYRLAGLAYGPGNAPFQSLEELALVLGVDASLYHALSQFLTIYSGRPDVNLSAASPELQNALAEEDELFADFDPDDMSENNSLERRVVNAGTTFTVTVEALLPSEVRERLAAVVRLHPTRANAPLRYELLRWEEGR